jgi:hypothetical protein
VYKQTVLLGTTPHNNDNNSITTRLKFLNFTRVVVVECQIHNFDRRGCGGIRSDFRRCDTLGSEDFCILDDEYQQEEDEWNLPMGRYLKTKVASSLMISIGLAWVLFPKYSAPNLQREEGWIRFWK